MSALDELARAFRLTPEQARYVGGTEAVAAEQIAARAPGALPDLHAGYRAPRGHD